ncbi:MAG TPA: amidohydrolase family protein [Gammaproteobacteria bacterium]|nr:amidohydrolase family protein [Gammaproteobacteria bacterium]
MRPIIVHGFNRGLAAAAFLVLAACSGRDAGTPAAPTPAAGGGVTAFTGARLIVGDGTVIENATFTLGPDKHFGLVGSTAAVTPPAGATKVDLTGLTVMPAIVDAHTHLSRERAALIADLKHRAYFGVSAALSLGQDNGGDVFAVRKEVIPGAALYRLAGRGITAPEPGRNDIPYWVTTEDEARAAVREQAALGVDIIKIWVDDRLGKYKKLAPELYGAAIDEAHKAGLRAIAHEYYLTDAKQLLGRGIDAFAHGVRDSDVDDEFISLLKAHPGFVLIPNLPDRGVATDLSWLSVALPPAQLEPLQAAAVDNPEAQAFFAIQARNLARVSGEGITIALGTDGNTPWGPHLEMADMVATGMSPSDVIVAATRNAAAFLKLDDAGIVAPGKIGSFIVLEANPLDDITNTRKIRDVYLRGDKVDRTSY